MGAKFALLKLDMTLNMEDTAFDRQVIEWRRSTVNVLVDEIDNAVCFIQETGWSCIIRIGFVWQRDFDSRANKRRRRYLRYLFAFAHGILIEARHRPGEMGPHAIPHAFNVYATDMKLRLGRPYEWHTRLGQPNWFADEYYIQFTVNRLETPPPPDHPTTTLSHGIRKACCDSALNICPICMEEKRHRVCFSCGHTVCMCV